MMKTKPDWEKLFIIARDLQSSNKGTAEGAEITVAQERILSYVFACDGMMQSQLVQFLHNTPATVSVAVESLVKKGLLKRVPKEGDRRVVILKLTAEGERLKGVLRQYFDEKMEELFQGISEKERKIFSSVLTELASKSEKIYSKDKKEN